VKVFRILLKFLQKIAIFQRFSSTFAPILIKLSRNFAKYFINILKNDERSTKLLHF